MLTMDTKKNIPISVGFSLPLAVHKTAIALSARIASQHKVLFKLGEQAFIPHVTLYFNEYPQASSDEIRELVREVSKSVAPISINFTKFFSGRGYVDISIERSKDLEKIHKKVVKLLFPLLKGHLREKYMSSAEKYNSYSDEQKQNIKLYGHPDVMGLYRRHLTLSRLEDENTAGKLITNMVWPISSCILDSIGVYEMGEHGSWQRKIETLKLKIISCEL